MGEIVELLMDLRSLRREAKLSTARVAELSGIGPSTLDRIESGEAPGLGNALRLARFLRTPVEEIWGLKDGKTRDQVSGLRGQQERGLTTGH